MTIRKAALLLCTCFLAPVAVGGSLDDWVGQDVRGSENVVCKKDVRGEYFFVARAGSKVKVGSRLDVTGDSEPRSTAVAWMFQNSEGKSLSSEVRPTSVRSKYVRDGDKIFAENVEYQTLKGKVRATVRVGVVVRKCATQQCTIQHETIQEPKYTIRLCEFPMEE